MSTWLAQISTSLNPIEAFAAPDLRKLAQRDHIVLLTLALLSHT